MIETGRIVRNFLVIEAGPQERITIPFKDGKGRTETLAFAATVQEHASGTLVGFDEQLLIQLRRGLSVPKANRGLRVLRSLGSRTLIGVAFIVCVGGKSGPITAHSGSVRSVA